MFVERAILRLGGTFMPEGDLYRIETPSPLLAYRNVSGRYDSACFRRDIAMRRKKAELMVIGHPLVDAIIAHLSRPSVAGDVSSIDFWGRPDRRVRPLRDRCPSGGWGKTRGV
jgi:hypothetical protein